MPDELLLQSLLATDGRIVSEDDTHAVITIRLRKDIITRNLPLLAALAELTSSRRSAALPTWPGPGWG